MSTLTKLQCDNCGGRIDGTTLICQSCGMQYRLNEEFGHLSLIKVETSDVRFNTYGVGVSIPAFYVEENPKSAMLMGMEELCGQLAKKILPLVEYQASFDIKYNNYNLYGRLRIAEPRNQDELLREYGRMTGGKNLL